MTPEPAPGPLSLPWRCHAEHGRGLGIVYVDGESGASMLIGVMDSPEMAAEVCVLHNERLAAKLARPPLA